MRSVILGMLILTACAHDQTVQRRTVPINQLAMFPEVVKRCSGTATVTHYQNGDVVNPNLRDNIVCAGSNEFGDARGFQFWYGEKDGKPNLIDARMQTNAVDEIRRQKK